MSEQARKEFEELALVLAVKHYGYKEGDALLKSILECRANGRYMVDWVDGAWIGYQAGLESVVVELPAKVNPDDALDSEWHNVRDGTIDACGRSIEAAGVRVKR